MVCVSTCTKLCELYLHTSSSTLLQPVSICEHTTKPNVTLNCQVVSVCVTCLCGGDQGGVSLAVLPVDIQVWTLRQSYHNVHKSLVTRYQKSCLSRKMDQREKEATI